MGKVYYVEDLRMYIPNIKDVQHHQENIQNTSNLPSNLPVPLGENIIEIDSDEQRDILINAIKGTDHIEDNSFQNYIQTDFPLFFKYVKETPIDLKKFKNEFKEAFFEIPDQYFEDDNTIRALKRILNFIITKNQISFTLINILNGKLEYNDKKYQYKKPYQFYFRMIKLNYDLPEYFTYLLNLQRMMERMFLRDLFFSDRKEITKKDLRFIMEAYNVTGKNLVDFRYHLQNLHRRINDEKIFIKRTQIPIPPNYWNEEIALLEKIEDVQSKTESAINDIAYRKEEIVKYIQEKKGLFDIDNLKTLFKVLDIFDWFF